jgi:DNA-directed RNA polymerase specialized sigma24 family protein
VFLMRVKEGLSFKEIAKAQNVSISTALARMQYGLSKLRHTLGPGVGMLSGGIHEL